MQYRLDNYTKNQNNLMRRLADNCMSRRLEKGYSRKTLSERSGVPAPTIEKFEKTGKISLESFCKIVIEFDFHDEMAAIMDRTKFMTGEELDNINRNKNRKKGR